MGRFHQLAGPADSAIWRATSTAYYTSIAETDRVDLSTVRHRLRPDAGTGTIEVTALRSGFHIVRYDVEFRREHRVGFALPADNFEIEHCLDGRMDINESGGAGCLHSGSVALSPRRATAGSLCYPARERYRAVSVIGSWTRLELYLNSLGVETTPPVGPEDVARERYRSGSDELRPAAAPLAEIFSHRRQSPGRPLFLESRLAAALSSVIDGGVSSVARPILRVPAFDDHELVALRRIPARLWRERHAPPTVVELARASSMSVRRLTAGFRALYGVPVMEHHRRCCLDRAAILLVETDWTLDRIAHEVGYASAGNFGYAFRRHRGWTPLRFRQMHS